MKQQVCKLVIIFLSMIQNIDAQNKPFRGSGNIKTITYTQAGYDKLNIFDFEGKIDVVVGQSHHVVIQIDDNIAPLVEFDLDKSEYRLTIRLRDNKNGKRYLEDIQCRIKITLPETSVISHRGNSDLNVTGLLGRYFRIEHTGNGDVRLQGKMDAFDIEKNGNGGVFAENLLCNEAKVNTIGNGDVKINASKSLLAKGVGNGDIIQYGKGKQKALSKIIGNGSIIMPL